MQIKNDTYSRTSKAITNFKKTLPPLQSDLARQTLKDPYIFDFLSLDTEFREKKLEAGLLSKVYNYLILLLNIIFNGMLNFGYTQNI